MKQARLAEGRQPRPRPATIPRRTGQRPAENLAHPAQAPLLPWKGARAAGQGHPRPSSPGDPKGVGYQITYAGHPLYLFDQQPGAVTGEGWFEPGLPPWYGIWWLMSPGGEPVPWAGTLTTTSINGKTVLAEPFQTSAGWVNFPVYTFSRDQGITRRRAQPMPRALAPGRRCLPETVLAGRAYRPPVSAKSAFRVTSRRSPGMAIRFTCSATSRACRCRTVRLGQPEMATESRRSAAPSASSSIRKNQSLILKARKAEKSDGQRPLPIRLPGAFSRP